MMPRRLETDGSKISVCHSVESGEAQENEAKRKKKNAQSRSSINSKVLTVHRPDEQARQRHDASGA